MSMQDTCGKRFVFDLDDTLCTFTNGHYELAKPFQFMIDKVNRLYEEGNYIIIFTARGSGTGLDWTKVTERQLSEWGVKYHELKFGKPYADYYIDDRNLSIDKFIERF